MMALFTPILPVRKALNLSHSLALDEGPNLQVDL